MHYDAEGGVPRIQRGGATNGSMLLRLRLLLLLREAGEHRRADTSGGTPRTSALGAEERRGARALFALQ